MTDQIKGVGMVNIAEAQALVQAEKDLPTMLEDIERMEEEIAPIKKDIASQRAIVKAFMVDAGLDSYDAYGWQVRLIGKVRKTLNVELVQKAISKTMWDRITRYEDPNGGKKVKRAYVETTSNTLTIDREVD
jgi:uncharacterized protein (UPF0335 family)